ncbi:MAG: hypothetical protein R3D59_14090 [Paracoccaceae bacterium]
MSLTLSIDAGDRIALIGSNGRARPRCSGRCSGITAMAERSASTARSARRRDVGVLGRFVPQPSPPLRMPVGEIAGLRREGRGRIAGADDRDRGRALGIDLDEVRGRPFYRPLGRQKQKILVTVALGVTQT